LVPVLNLPSAQLVHVVSSEDVWLLEPAVKYSASGNAVPFKVQEVSVLRPGLYVPAVQPVHSVSSDVLWLLLPAVK